MLLRTLLYKNETLAVKIKKSTLSKKLTIRPNYKLYGCTVTIPKHYSYKQGLNFAEKNIIWLVSALEKSKPKTLENLKEIHLLGTPFNIIILNKNTKLKIKISDNNIIITSNQLSNKEISSALEKFLKSLAKKYFKAVVEEQTNKLNIKYNKLIIRDCENKWGSCSSLKNISLNWRLILAPKSVADYVIIHEVAHLIHFNHSKNFWDLVKQLHCNFKKDKLWLKENGKTLYYI